MRIINLNVDEAHDGKKLIGFLRGQAKVSLRLLRKLKTDPEGIKVNGQPARTVDIVKAGDNVELRISDSGEAVEAVEMPLEILYEDNDLLVINKPAGLAMHPTHNHQGDTLANAVAWYLNKKGVNAPLRAVGRLDKGTSGVVVCALNPFAASKLSGKLEKEYYAVVGAILPSHGTIDVPIYRPDPMKTLRACGEHDGAEHAVTNWTAIKTGDAMTLVSVRPETGRTHQIRVHFAHAFAPLIGDDMYGSPCKEPGHQLLHCKNVTLTHPVTGEKMTFTAPLPEDFEKFFNGGSICTKI